MNKIRVGCCGWAGSKKEYYKHFTLVEIQQTFYQPPDNLSTVEKWRNEAPDNFEFVVKAWQLITHEPSSPTYRRLKENIPDKEKQNYGFFKPTKEVFNAWERIDEIARILNSRIILFQCPGSFKPTLENKENLINFFNTIERRSYIFVWELRGDWKEEEIMELSRKLDLIHCVDPFKQRPTYGAINYFRLHGRPGYNLKYEYTYKDLEELKKMCDKPVNYCLFNNLSMAKDAQRFKTIIKCE